MNALGHAYSSSDHINALLACKKKNYQNNLPTTGDFVYLFFFFMFENKRE